jgi:deoxyribodipyrimidine photo-lyase
MKTIKKKSLIWCRQDLRLDDNPALNYAAENGYEIYLVYIFASEEEGDWAYGAASRWWLHHSLKSLDAQLRAKNGKLIVLKSSNSFKILESLVKKHSFDAVFWNRRYEPAVRERDEKIKKSLSCFKNIEVKSFNSHLLWEPWEISTQQGTPFQVYSPFWRKATSTGEPSRPQKLSSKAQFGTLDMGLNVSDLGLLPTLPWDEGFSQCFEPGETASLKRFRNFLKKRVGDYKSRRDFPSELATSSMSPYLRFGEVSVRRLWFEVREAQEKTTSKKEKEEMEHYLKELAWREFAYHLLFHFKHTPEEPLRARFKKFPWRKDYLQFKAWQQGKTGYPIVDAGMRELWHTGWMHNRVRMIVASFLVKDLRISWFEGAKWFWDTLLDADLASNTLGWQWAGGCGADAAPYFRVFNPMTQGEKFDPEGEYVRKWVPEIAKLPNKWIQKPFEAPAEVLSAAGVVLGQTYPQPLVDHKQARLEALAAFKASST